MREVTSAIQEYVDMNKPVPWLTVQHQGKKHKVRLFGVPDDIY
jgi:hypothetical protein